MATDDLTVGGVARACGVSPDTIRHYERKGAIPAAARAANGYRSYPAETVARVRRIRRAIALGFTLHELGRLFRQRAVGKPPCREVRAMAERKLAELETRIAEMQALRDALVDTVRTWDERLAQTPEGEAARLLDSL